MKKGRKRKEKKEPVKKKQKVWGKKNVLPPFP